LSLFGPIIASWNLEQAVLGTLRGWMPEYLAELERQNSLQQRTIPRPPAPESYHGGTDLDTWTQDDLPEVIVVVKPDGRPEPAGSGEQAQAYRVEIGCQWLGLGSALAEQPEDEARAVASYLGTATLLLLQHPTLGGIAERIVLVEAPDVSTPDPEQKALAQVSTVFTVWVPSIINESLGPIGDTPSGSPEYPGAPEEPWADPPTVESVHLTVEAESL
jgi:hypothetical protein